MARILLTAGALVVALVLIPTAGAAKISTVANGDLAFATGTDLACAVAKAHGKLAVDCFRANAKGFVPNAYSVGLSADGRAVLQHVDAKGDVSVVRKLQAAAAATRNIELAAGDGFKVAGSDLACIVVGKAISCFHYNGTGSVPNSYGIVLTDAYATVVKYDAKGKAHSLVTKLQG